MTELSLIELSMIEIKVIEELRDLNALKKEYFSQSTAPLDGMWHFGFVPMAKHVGFYFSNTLIGFACINDDGYLLQFHLTPAHQANAPALFSLITTQNTSKLNAIMGQIKGAFASTAEPLYLSLCLEYSNRFNVNSLMYQLAPTDNKQQGKSIEMTIASSAQLEQFVQFSAENINAPTEWLISYYSNLIQRKELWGYWCNEALVATGECRLFDQYQTNFSDLGVIVAKTERKRGLAKKVLCFLTQHATKQGLAPICSTESSNAAAQKAIAAAGFLSVNRIIKFEF
ncbi:MAG: GNAT family N-acetyltransferase [Thalassotalea sp.]